MSEHEKFIKVYLKGESPFVEFVKSTGDNTFIGKITNNLINSEEHGYFKDDEVEFYLKDYGSFKSWEPK
jgi:hypothetical protein